MEASVLKRIKYLEAENQRLKQMYAEKEELDPTKIRMFFGGRELKDDQTLASYYIRNQMVVQVFLKS